MEAARAELWNEDPEDESDERSRRDQGIERLDAELRQDEPARVRDIAAGLVELDRLLEMVDDSFGSRTPAHRQSST
jgi:hypothetical protein